VSEGLYERLRRGRGPLESLEQEILGEASEVQSLKERLERLVAVTTARRSPAPVSLEELVPGKRVQNERGEFLLFERDLHVDLFHGDVTLSRFRALPERSVEILDPSLECFDLRRAVFLDTETTGLAGGAGTAAFLVGIGFLDDDHFRIRQYFMRDYSEEPALLHSLAEDLAPFAHLVTFNGKMFDVPLLESRYQLARRSFPLQRALHLDLLHPARRLWKARRDSCRLQALERSLLGVFRSGDVRGEDIPQIYFDYLRSRDARGVAGILEHNHLDVVSLAALAALACQWLEEGRAEDPVDVFSLARVLERAGLHERSLTEYRRALDGGPGPALVPSLLRLGRQAKRDGDNAEAVVLFERAAEQGNWIACRELAVYHEHTTRDLSRAAQFAQQGLRLSASRGDVPARATFDFRRRRDRLERKLRSVGTRDAQ
jgi:uncharacterized protein YprB with RNaseH-like and TPR domain